jgi:HlyD family secretion protein
LPRPPRPITTPARPSPATGTQQVWVPREGQPVSVSVTVGVTDGRLTEVTSGELQDGMQVITEALGTSP